MLPDADAVYAGKITLDLGDVTPHVSGPDSVQVMRSVADIAKEQGEDPEGVPGVLREQSSRGSRGGGAGDQGQAGRRGRRVLRRRGERRGAAGRRGERRLGHAARGRREAAAVGLRHVHRPGRRPARGGRGRHLRHQPQLQGPHGLARREGLPGQPAGGRRVGRRRLHHGARRGGRQAAGLHASRRWPPRPRRPTEKVAILDGFPAGDRGPAGLPARGQPEHRRHLRQGLHLPRADARGDGQGRHGELRPDLHPEGGRRAR